MCTPDSPAPGESDTFEIIHNWGSVLAKGSDAIPEMKCRFLIIPISCELQSFENSYFHCKNMRFLSISKPSRL